MRRISAAAVLLVLILGCQSQSSSMREEIAPDNHENCNASIHTEIDHWLFLRERLCNLSIDDQRSRLKYLSQKSVTASRDYDLEMLLLASCHPDMTPGILRKSISQLSNNENLSLSEKLLVNLMKDFDTSYQILEEKNIKLEIEIKRNIEGIKNIESEIGNINNNGESR